MVHDVKARTRSECGEGDVSSENGGATVFVVDDTAAIRESLSMLFETAGYPVECFGSGQEFLAAYGGSRPGCLVLDVKLPGINGLELQDQLAARNIRIPIIMMTGYADVPMAVRALRHGALDFIQKPFDTKVLLERVRQAIHEDSNLRREAALTNEMKARVAEITRRELEVMKLVVDGHPNKIIAARLGVSAKTVEAHRSQVMRKMQAGSVAELVRMAQRAEI